MSLLIYTNNINPRKAYLFQFFFEEILGVDFECTAEESVFVNSDRPKLNYSERDLGCGLWIKEYGLLQQFQEISEQDIRVVAFDTYKAPFAVGEGDLPFDLFSASFYLLSRYEEYLSKEKDQYGRFHGKQSLAYKSGFLRKPVVDEWAFQLLNLLKKKYPLLENKKRSFRFQPTLDIDMPYYLRSEGLIRRLLKSVKLLLKGNLKFIYRDPFNVYADVKEWDEKYRIQTLYFLLMGNKHQLDNPTHLNKQPFIKLISQLDPESIGLHPSFQSNSDISELEKEKQILESLVGEKIMRSRQHYLMLTLPASYRNLLDNGIKEDYTMAFADEAGFRAGTCSPFFWYDLSREKITDLKVYPTAVMDQTLKRYQKFSVEEAKREIFSLIDSVKNVNGMFISLWHNESIGDFGQWKDWKIVYIELLEYASTLD